MANLKDLIVQGPTRAIGRIYAPNGLEGVADISIRLGTATVGGTSTPIYLDGGLPKAITGFSAATINAGTLSADRLPTSGVTAGSYGPSANASPAHGGTFSVPYVTVDNKGRLTAASTKTITLPAQYSHPTYTAATSGLYKITVNTLGHVSATAAVTASDLPDHTHNYVPNTQAGVNAALNLLSEGSSVPVDNDYYISQYVNGGTTTTTYHRRPVSKLWDLFKTKISATNSGSGSVVVGVTQSNGAFTVSLGEPQVTVTNPTTQTNYGILFAANPNTSERNTLRKNNNLRLKNILGTATTEGSADLIVGNNIAKGTADNETGRLTLYSDTTHWVDLVPVSGMNADRTINITNASGNMMVQKKQDSFWGIIDGDGSDTSWIRTPKSGLIPYAPDNNATNGNATNIGSATWHFKAAYVNDYTAKVVTAATLGTVSGSTFLKGNDLIGNTADWVGLQAHGSNDRFQLFGWNNRIIFRQNDNTDATVTDANWSKWVAFVTPDDISGSGGITVTPSTDSIGTGDDAVSVPRTVTISHSNSVTAVTTAGFYKVKYDAQGHVTGTTAVAKADITALGIPGSNTDENVTQSVTTTANYRPLLSGATNKDTAQTGLDDTITGHAYASNNFFVQPSTGKLFAKHLLAHDKDGGSVSLEFWRGSNRSHRIINESGALKFQTNYTADTSANWTRTTDGAYSTNVFDINVFNGASLPVVTLNSFLRHAGYSSAWWNDRDNAVVQVTTAGSGYYPIIATKTKNSGSWGVGNHNDDTLVFNYISTTQYAAKTNPADSALIQIRFNSTGSIRAKSESTGFEIGGSAGRIIYYNGNGPQMYMPSSGNWAMGTSYYLNNTTTKKGFMGAYGSATAVDYFAIGPEYNNHTLKIFNNNTGLINIRGTTPQIQFTNTTTDKGCTTNGIWCDAANTYGMNMYIQSGGNVVIGSGESSSNFKDATKVDTDGWTDGGENMYVMSDGDLLFFSKCNTITNRARMLFSTAGNLWIPTTGRYGWTADANGFSSAIINPTLTATRTWTMPDKTGTVALVSDIPTYTGSSGISVSGTSITHSNSITAVTTAAFKKIKYDAQGHITGTADVAAADLPSHTHSTYVLKEGDTMTGNLTMGTPDQSAIPTAGITIQDIRNATNGPDSGVQKGVNFYFTNAGSPGTGWWSIMHVRGWTSSYSAWELAGPSHNADQRTTPLYVRSSNAGTAWGAWRKIYDSSNPPTAAEVGASPTGHTHDYIPLAGSNAVTGAIKMSATNMERAFAATDTSTTTTIWMGVGSGHVNHGLYSDKLNAWMVYADDSTHLSIHSKQWKPTTDGEASGYLAIPLFANAVGDGGKKLVNNDGLRYEIKTGTADVEGAGRLVLGNGTAIGSANNKTGVIRLFSGSTKYVNILANSLTNNINVTIPNVTSSVSMGVLLKSNNFWGMIDGDGSDTNWIRSTKNGIIPYAQNSDATNGLVSKLGTSTWSFKEAWIEDVQSKNLVARLAVRHVAGSDGSYPTNTIDNISGSGFIYGNNIIGNAYDWVGLQAHTSADKFQILAGDNRLIFRQNDSGGTDATNWQPWVRCITPGDISGENGITVTQGTESYGTGADAVTIPKTVKIGHSNSITAVTTAGFYKVKFDAYGHITGTTAVAKADITGLGIPGSNTDEKVKQTADSSTTTAIPVLLKNASTSGTAADSKYNANVTVTPSTGTVTATKYNVNSKATMEYDSSLDAIKFVFS